MCSKRSGMKPPDRSDPPADVGNALYSLDPVEPFALFRVPGNKNNLIDHLLERINQALDKCPALVREKILLLPMCTPCLATN
jgi:hypothetical protein